MQTTVQRLEETIQGAIERRVFPGAACALTIGGRVRYQGAWGTCDTDSQRAVSAETIFDLASLTKPISTATSWMVAIERGMATLEQDITHWFPEAKHLQGVTIRHLLTHTSGLPSWKPFYKQAKNREEMLEAVLKTPLDKQPNSGYEYSDLGYMLLGAALEKVFDRSQAEIFREEIASPLGLSDTGYLPSNKLADRIAATAHSENRPKKSLKGEAHDENAHVLGGIAGHAGLFGTLNDLLKYAQMLLKGGKPLLAYYTVQQMFTPQMHGKSLPNGTQTLAFFAHPNALLARGDLFPTRCVGHTGFTGTVILFDPQIELGLVFLSNHVYFSREKAAYLDTRRRILNLLATLASRE